MVVKKNRKVLALLLIVLVGCFAAYRGIRTLDKRASDFSVERIALDITYNTEWRTSPSKEEIKRLNAIFNQPFYYSRSGFLCYDFESADGEWVIKFIQNGQSPVSRFLDLFTMFPFVAKRQRRKQELWEKRVKRVFDSFKRGYERGKEETGVVFVHLMKTVKQYPTITVYDASKKRYQISLDTHEFALLKKALVSESAMDTLRRMRKKVFIASRRK